MKKIFISLLLIGSLVLFPSLVKAEDITIYFFRGSTCPHCEEALDYINEHKDQLGDIKLVTYEVWQDAKNEKLHSLVGDKLGLTDKQKENVPLIVIGDQYQIGMYGNASDFNGILSIANSYKENGEYKDIVAETIQENELKVHAKDLDKLYAKVNPLTNIIIFSAFGVLILGFVWFIAFSTKK